jgi:hypothetical protein
MRKRILPIALIALLLSSALLTGSCSGKLDMVTGCWKLVSTGDENGNNQQDASGGLPISMYYNIYPDGKVYMFILDTEEFYGTFKMDRDTFEFKSVDGKGDESGSFTIDYSVVDEDTGRLSPRMTIFLDSEPMSVVLRKVMDYKNLLKYKKEKEKEKASVSPGAGK